MSRQGIDLDRSTVADRVLPRRSVRLYSARHRCRRQSRARVLIAEYLSFQPALPDKIDKRRNLGIYKPVFARQVEEERRLVG